MALGEQTLGQLLSSAGNAIGNTASTLFEASPPSILARLIGSVMGQSQSQGLLNASPGQLMAATSPQASDTWSKMQNRIAVEEGEKILRKHISNNLTQAMQTNPQATSQMISTGVADQTAEDEATATTIAQGATSQGLSQSVTTAPMAQPASSAGMDMNQITNSPLFRLGALLSMAGTGLKGENPMEILTGIMTMGHSQIEDQLKTQKLMGTEPLQPKDKLTAQIELDKVRLTSGAEILKQENKSSDDFREDTKTLTPAFDSMNNIAAYYSASQRDPGNGANDLGLSYELIKMFDPNAVKEGELANLKRISPSIQWVARAYNQAFKGTNLTDDVRSKIYTAAKTKYDAVARNYDTLANRYAEKIKKYGGEPTRALVNRGLTQNQAKGQTKQQGINKTPSGNTFRRIQ